jgi:biopolymer transport protein ExbD
MNLRPTLREKSEPHSSALNDILFILLFFFLIVATLANPNVIRVIVPKAKSDTKAKQTVVVSINAQQEFFIGTTKVPAENLQQTIADALIKNPDAEKTIVINADTSVSLGGAMVVMRVAQALKTRAVLAVDKN